MKVNAAVKYVDIEKPTIPVSFRLDRELVEALRDFCRAETWPPPPSQTEVVARGIRIVLDNLEPPKKHKRGKARA